ncbi:hypothetical protein EDC18_10226 [Natranaerovirga pectinivora]|uniref:Uncharacterized protein n=1 Tax=Natranaerovirga pectinivora TaxID=682400 RepID=A0A4R3MND0_9FIRM|nr:hypothetical protein [Natranaerovirga pectinivora]TCT16012.1 hypothetical protein EDC18_10226 [Natranaerovirga pectinivora]
MSHAVRIDYQGISIQCQSICEMASSQLCKLDRMLDVLESGSTRLLNSQTDALRKEITKIKQQIQNKIDSVLSKAKKKASLGRVVVDSDYMGSHANAYEVINEAEELEVMVTTLADTKLVEMESLLNQLMNSQLATYQEKLKDLASGRIRINYDVQEKINMITDEVIRQYVYLAWVDNPDASYDSLYSLAMKMKYSADNRQYVAVEEKKIEEIKTELRDEKIDEKTIEKIVSQNDGTAKERVQKARELANAEIVNEKVRRESVKIIVQAIKKRGFFVDVKSIKIDRENNQVNILAQKPSGAKAEFKVFMDGKFEYRFDGYEGQACQKDIKPFMDELEDVYGIKVIKQTEIWSNPDKNSTMKYQTIDYNKNKG